MRAFLTITALLCSLHFAATRSRAECWYYAPPVAPDMRNPGFYYTNNCQTYGPNYNVRPPFPPFQGMIKGPCGNGSGCGSCGTPNCWPYVNESMTGGPPNCGGSPYAGYPGLPGRGPGGMGGYPGMGCYPGMGGANGNLGNQASNMSGNMGQLARMEAERMSILSTYGCLPFGDNAAQMLAYQRYLAACGYPPMSPQQGNPQGRPIVPVPVIPVPYTPAIAGIPVMPSQMASGILGFPTPQQQQGGQGGQVGQDGGDGQQGGPQSVMAFPSHLFSRSPRDFFMIETDPRSRTAFGAFGTPGGRTGIDYP